MSVAKSLPLSAGQFRRLAETYRHQWPMRLAVIDPSGRRVASRSWWPGGDDAVTRGVHAFALQQALEWGEPTVSYAPRSRLVWVAPLMHNAVVLGGLAAGMDEAELFDADATTPRFDLRAACAALRELLERHNLTNAAFLSAQRQHYMHEQDRAEALRTIKLDAPASMRQVLFNEEPALLAAVRRTDRPAARAVLNRVLTVALHQAGARFELVKSVMVELVAALARTAVEAGGETEELLGSRFCAITELAQFRSMEQLAPWLHDWLERMMDVIERGRDATGGMVMADALAYMAANLHRPLSRNEVAATMHLSPSHFSRQFRRHVGRSFSQVLTRMRAEQAAELLVRTDLSIGQIAAATGFTDQGYLTKVFRAQMGQTPSGYRQSRGGSRSPIHAGPGHATHGANSRQSLTKQ